MVKCTLGKLFALSDAVKESTLLKLERVQGIKSAKIKWKLVVILSEINGVLRSTEKPRLELLEKFGTQDINSPNLWKLNPETLNEYAKQSQELADTEIELNINPLKLEELDGSNIEVSDMILLRNAGLLIE